MAIPRCAKCSKGGVTTTSVVSMATEETPGCVPGDFLCLLHNHKTAVSIPPSARAESN